MGEVSRYSGNIMNVRSHLPGWAQKPTQQFIEKSPIQGTSTSPMTPEGFEDSFKMGAGAVQLAGYDEVPREDSALGLPGEVSRNGLHVYFEGDTSLSRGDFEAVLSARRRGTEYVTYVQAHGGEYSVLRMVNEDGDVEVKGSQVHRTAQGPEGFLIAGNFSV